MTNEEIQIGPEFYSTNLSLAWCVRAIQEISRGLVLTANAVVEQKTNIDSLRLAIEDFGRRNEQ